MRAVVALAILLTFTVQASARTVIDVIEPKDPFYKHLYFKNARDVLHYLKVPRWTEEAKDDPSLGIRSANLAAHDPNAVAVRDIAYHDSTREFYVVTPDGTFSVFQVKVDAEYRSDTNMYYTDEDTDEYLYFPVRE